MTRPWEADSSASFARRLGGGSNPVNSGKNPTCPDIWELDNGDYAVIGRDLTAAYTERLPDSVNVAKDERLVVIPRATLTAARADIPDA